WMRGDFVRRDRQKFVDGGGCQFLLDAVAVGGVLEGGHGDDVDCFWERIGTACYVVAATGHEKCNRQRYPTRLEKAAIHIANAVHWRRFSASLMAVAAGR